jgi:hypothetical protein
VHFHEKVYNDVTAPIIELCALLMEEDELEQHAFFSGLLPLLAEPIQEEQVLAAVIELSRCAFLGFQYSPMAALQIDQLLAQSIDLAHTMSAQGMH